MRASRSCVLGLAALVFTFSADAVDLEKITINGYTSFEFERQWERAGSGNGDPNGSFDADSISLVMNFHASDKVRTALDVTYEHGVATEDNRGNVAVEFGFVEYTVSDLLRIRAGKFLTPFGIFNEIHDAKPAFLAVREAPSVTRPDRIIDQARGFYPRWGAGIQVTGDGSLKEKTFDYSLMIANGDQKDGNPFEEDDNSFKGLTARMRYEPRDDLRVGASVYVDRFSNAGSAPYSGEFRSVRSHGVEVEWIGRKVRVLSEAVYGSFHGAHGNRNVSQLGGYVQPSYHFSDKFAAYARYDRIDADRGAKDVVGHLMLAGLNFEIWRMIFKVENDWFKGGRNTDLAKFPGRDYSEFKVSVSVGF